jgi:putative ATPase
MTIQNRPLADLMRPETLSDVIGQDHLFGETGALAVIEKSKNVPSMILWGPPGVGKTTIAKALAKISNAEFVAMSAINSGAAEIRKVVDRARMLAHTATENALFEDNQTPTKTILMVDEIHHFNKTQQDLFLPFIEDGTIILIGTTTENPSFQLNSALLSRCKVITLKILDDAALAKILARVEKNLGKKLKLSDAAREALINLACGDARYFLNACEELFALDLKSEISAKKLTEIISKRSAHFDKKGDFHFNLISAFHKSLRGSDVDAALYYLARMLEAKEDPYYILRRLARFATEDVGLADPNGLLQVMAAKENYDFLGSPEGDYALSHATIYLATAPKSNASYMAHKAAIDAASATTDLMPPKNILNAPTKMMKNEGYGEGYIYDHDTPNCFSGQEFFPPELLKKARPKFFEPNERGFERDLKKRLEYWEELRRKLKK